MGTGIRNTLVLLALTACGAEDGEPPPDNIEDLVLRFNRAVAECDGAAFLGCFAPESRDVVLVGYTRTAYMMPGMLPPDEYSWPSYRDVNARVREFAKRHDLGTGVVGENITEKKIAAMDDRGRFASELLTLYRDTGMFETLLTHPSANVGIPVLAGPAKFEAIETDEKKGTGEITFVRSPWMELVRIDGRWRFRPPAGLRKLWRGEDLR